VKSGSHGEVKLFTFIGGRFTHSVLSLYLSGRYESEDVRFVTSSGLKQEALNVDREIYKLEREFN
jgi:hypothetical protein